MLTSEEMSEKILDYLLNNPDAGDTLEGVSSWWIEMEKVEQTVDIVRNALDILLKKGLIEKMPARKSAPVYRINRLLKDRLHKNNSTY